MAAKTKRKPALKSPLPEHDVRTFEVFGRPNPSTGVVRLTNQGPTCFNGQVDVVRYRITIELIPEPVEVIVSRVEELMWATSNPHTREALRKFWAEARATVQGWPDRDLTWDRPAGRAS